jgi:hypothetical protein
VGLETQTGGDVQIYINDLNNITHTHNCKNILTAKGKPRLYYCGTTVVFDFRAECKDMKLNDYSRPQNEPIQALCIRISSNSDAA